VRKLSKTLAMMSLLAPMGASALGIGDIKLRSALNQSLNAEIPLVLSGGDSLADVKIALASPEAFAKAGLERHYFLTKLRFTAVQKPDGGYAIEVSSNDVMREPFVSFLVEVNWPRGRVVREYTVLLDPPATFSDRALVDANPPSVFERPADAYQETAETPASSRTFQPRPSTGSASSESGSLFNGSEYGPVKRDSTLWEIAKLVNRDPSITQEQMVIALYRHNPNVFYGNTPDALKAGETLKVPDREFIQQFTSSQARNELYRLNNSRTGKLASRDKKTPNSDATAGPTTQPTQAQLKLLAPADTKAKDEEAVTGSTDGAGKSKGEIALEIAETVKQENEDLRSRLTQLEQQLSEMHRLLTLKNEQIALLQAPQAQQASTESTKKEPPNPEQLIVQTPPDQETQKPADTSGPIENPQPPQELAGPEAVQTPPPAAAPTEEPKIAPPKPTPAPPPPEQSGFLDTMFDQQTYLGAAGGLMLLAVIPWLIARRRAAMIEETESILIATEKENLQRSNAVESKFDSTISGPTTVAKTSFLSEFTPSDFDALGAEADEVDPISEADVYLAYGRYKQAEDLIRNAIEQYPERDECKLKLLEIHYATENRDAFERFAQELKAQGKDGNPEFWGSVVEMGRELCPSSSLFSGSPSSNRTLAFDSNSSDILDSIDLTDELIDDLRRFDSEVAETSTSTEEKLVTLDFNLDAQNSDEPAMAAEQPTVEFSVDSLRSENVPTTEPKDELPELENLIAFDTGKSQSDPQNKHIPQQPDNTIDDILRELTENAQREDRAESGDETSASGTEMFDFDFSSFAIEDARSDATEAESEQPKFDNLIAFNASKFNSHPENEIRGEAAQSIDDILRELNRNSVQQDNVSKPDHIASDPNTETPDFGFDLASSVQAENEALNMDDLEHLLDDDDDENDDQYAPLTDMDQLETKLDLAKAYADMGDKESALEMLKEVLEMGNEQQKAEAGALIDELNAQEAPPEPLSVARPGRRT
jgi:pilus assembly protein FimV